MPMATKHSRTVTYHEGVSPIKTHDPLLMSQQTFVLVKTY